MAERNKKSSNPMINIINDGISSVHSSKNVLSKLWKILIIETNVTAPIWLKQIDSWQMRMQLRKTDKDISSLKGNITSALAKDKVTWDKLLVGFNILDFVKLDIQLTLHNRRGKFHVLNMSVNIAEENAVEENNSQ